MTNPTKTRRRFTAQQRQEAVELCLSEGLSCTAVAQRLRLPNSSLAKWVRQARIDRGDFGPPEQGQLTSDERAELARLRKENRELRREKDFFQAGGSALCQRAASADRFRLIEALSDRFATAWLCRQLGVARSGFYAWRQRQQNPGPRARENPAITAQVQTVFDRHRGFYGAPRVHQEPRAAGLNVGRHRIARLMRCSVLKGNRASGVAENLLQQEFSPAAPNRCWAGDITYIRTTAGWRYLADWIDQYSRRVVGWPMGTTMEATLVLEALNRALGHCQIEPEKLLIYTDQRSQYRATAYRQLLENHKISCSMSAKGLLGQPSGGELLLHPQT